MPPPKGYKHYPFLTPSEFELACAFFDRRYIRAKLGPTRQTFKVRLRRTLTTGESYVEILRLLSLGVGDGGEEDELAEAIGKLGGEGKGGVGAGVDVEMRDEDEDMVGWSRDEGLEVRN
jgi:ubiquitin-like-conjugating enzyme ATG10